MSNIASKFLEAMGIVADKAVSGVAADETIYAQIVSIDTEQTNTYKLAYENSYITAIGSEQYNIGDIVEVKIPNGDFSTEKMIVGKWTGITTKQDFIAYEEEYKDRADLGISALVQINGDGEEDLREFISASALSIINRYRAFQLSGLFNYRFAPEINGALEFSNDLLDLDYGVELVCKDKEGNEHTYTLGINDFAGNPYSSYNSEISQTRLFALADGVELVEVTTFRVFVEGSSLLEENQSSYFNMTNFTVTAMGNLPVVQDVGTYVLNLSRTADTVLVDKDQILVNVATEARVLKGATRVALNTNNLKCFHGEEDLTSQLYFSDDNYVATLQLTKYPETWADIEYFEFVFYYGGEIVSKATLVVTRLQNGASPYSIVLSNDFDTVPARADGSVPESALSGATTTATIFYGNQPVTSTLQPEGEDDTTYLKIEPPEGIEEDAYTVEWDEENSQATVALQKWTGNNVDSQDFQFIYYLKGQPVAAKTFSIARVKMGSNAIDYSLKCTPNIINKTTIGDSCEITVAGYCHNGQSTSKMRLVDNIDDLVFDENEPVCYITYHWSDGVKKVLTGGSITYEKSIHKAEAVLTVEMTVAFLDVDGNQVVLLWETEEIQLLEDNSEYYSLVLDNDADVWIRRNTDLNIISELPVVTARIFKASTEITTYENLNIEIDTNSEKATDWWQLDGNQLKFIKDEIPSDLKYAQFMFQWIKDDVILSQQTFSIKVIEATYDYDLYIPQTVINNTNVEESTIQVQIRKIGDGAPKILSSEYELQSELLKISGGQWNANKTQYFIVYDSTSQAITVELTGLVNNINIIWDTEVIEFVHDGTKGIDGTNGTDGTTPHIGENGNWWIGNHDTEVRAWGTDATVTYENMWEQFKDKDSGDGIFQWTEGNSKFIGVNASMLKTGALCVGDKPEEPVNNPFYASITSANVYIGGWKANAGYLGTATKSIFLHASGDLNAHSIGNRNVSNLVFKAGDNFGVTNTGVLYANGANISGTLIAGSGSKIGGWQLTNNALQSEDESFILSPNQFKATDNFIINSSGHALLKSAIDNGMYFELDTGYVGNSEENVIQFGQNKNNNNVTFFSLSGVGKLSATGANIEGILTASANSTIGNLKVTDNTLQYLTGEGDNKVGMVLTVGSASSLEIQDSVGIWSQLNGQGLTIKNILKDGYIDIRSDGYSNLSKRKLPCAFFLSDGTGGTVQVYLYLTKDGTVKWATGSNIPLDELTGATAKIWDGSTADL